MVPHRFSSSLSMGLLVLPFVTVKAGLLSGAGKAAPLLRVRVVKAGRCRLVKKTGRPKIAYGKEAPANVTVPLHLAV